MKIYKSKSDPYVKMTTSVVLIVLFLVIVMLMYTEVKYGVLGGFILSIFIVAMVVYFYASALKEVILEKEMMTLKKNFGRVIIPETKIKSVHRIVFSNLTMTYGSKGVFGFIGNTMDGSMSLVKDRNAMIQIVTSTKKYIFSAEKPDELVNEIKYRYNVV